MTLLSKSQIIDTYSLLMKEYFQALHESFIIKEMNYPIETINIGIKTIQHVFETAIIKTKNVEKAYYCSKNAYSYYLEYIEQLYRVNLSENFNYMDIILFVYKKTIYELSVEDEDYFDIANSMDNDTISLDKFEWREFYLKLTNVMQVLISFENIKLDFHDYFTIITKYLSRFLTKLDNDYNIILFLETIHQKVHIEFSTYEKLLKELLKKLESKSSKIESLYKETIIKKCYIEESLCKEKIEDGNMKDFVKWLFVQ